MTSLVLPERIELSTSPLPREPRLGKPFVQFCGGNFGWKPLATVKKPSGNSMPFFSNVGEVFLAALDEKFLRTLDQHDDVIRLVLSRHPVELLDLHRLRGAAKKHCCR